MSKMMRTQGDWNMRYETGDLPWDTGRPDRHLQGLLADGIISPGPALELGCGTGTNAIWLARQGFEVTATDISDKAIAAAEAKALEAKALETKAGATFLALDVLHDKIPGGPFEFVYDRGCFHSFHEPADRASFAEIVAANLAGGGIWQSEIGNRDEAPREVGPPQLAALDIVTAVEPHFELLRLEAATFDGNQDMPPRMWLCLMRKRAASS